jgi:selenide,water dikinase
MGGKAVVALNIAMFPAQPEFFPSLHNVMKGGNDKMAEAGVSVIGGHTIRDKEPKFGYTVMGLIHPDKILDNTMAKPGDAMVLTKKIGTGVISTGVKAGLCSDAVIEEFTKSMATLNKRASEIMLEVGVSTATDITGFGLIGHLNEVLSASNCRGNLHADKVPFFEEAVRLAGMGKVPGGTMANFGSYSQYVMYHESVAETAKILLNDAQTSGGLLIFVPSERKDTLVSALQKEGILAAHIGDVAEASGDSKRIFVEQ